MLERCEVFDPPKKANLHLIWNWNRSPKRKTQICVTCFGGCFCSSDIIKQLIWYLKYQNDDHYDDHDKTDDRNDDNQHDENYDSQNIISYVSATCICIWTIYIYNYIYTPCNIKNMTDQQHRLCVCASLYIFTKGSWTNLQPLLAMGSLMCFKHQTSIGLRIASFQGNSFSHINAWNLCLLSVVLPDSHTRANIQHKSCSPTNQQTNC